MVFDILIEEFFCGYMGLLGMISLDYELSGLVMAVLELFSSYLGICSRVRYGWHYDKINMSFLIDYIRPKILFDALMNDKIAMIRNKFT